jgi:hypothetical protein
MTAYPLPQCIIGDAEAAVEFDDSFRIVSFLGNLLYDVVGLGLAYRQGSLNVLHVNPLSLITSEFQGMLLSTSSLSLLTLNNTGLIILLLALLRSAA